MISGLSIQWQVGNVPAGEDVMQRVAVAFERAGDNVADFSRFVFPKMVPVFEAAVAAQLEAQGRGPQRGAFAQLSARYAAWKEAHFPGKPILERTGALRAALTESGSPFAFRQFSGEEFDFGSQGVDYASFHQTGTLHMPDRPPFDFDSDFEENVKATALAGVREALAESRASEYLSEGG